MKLTPDAWANADCIDLERFGAGLSTDGDHLPSSPGPLGNVLKFNPVRRLRRNWQTMAFTYNCPASQAFVELV